MGKLWWRILAGATIVSLLCTVVLLLVSAPRNAERRSLPSAKTTETPRPKPGPVVEHSVPAVAAPLASSEPPLTLPAGFVAPVPMTAEDRAVIGDKLDTMAKGPEVQELSEEFKANPEFYSEGPGPHARHYQGRSGALPHWIRPEGAAPTTVLDSNEAEPLLQVWVPSVRVTAGEPIVIHAALKASHPVVIEDVQVEIGERDDQQPVSAQLRFVGAADAKLYQYSFVTPRAEPNKPRVRSFDYVVTAIGTDSGGSGFVRRAVGGFFVHAMGAAVDVAGTKVERRGGDVILQVPVTVPEAGTYFCYAELWGGNGKDERAIAFGVEPNAVLKPGAARLELLFGGRVIRDAKLDGPYTIRNLRFRRVDIFPFDEAPPVPVVLTTPDWKAATFH